MACPVEKLCGGCQSALAKQKAKRTAALFKKGVRVHPMIEADQKEHYRNKVIVAFKKEKGRVMGGLYAQNSHRVVGFHDCGLQPRRVNELVAWLAKMVESMKIELYNPKTRSGLLRHILVRTNTKGQMMVVFVLAHSFFPGRKNLIKALREAFPEVVSIFQSINGRDTSVVMENGAECLWGKPYLEESFLGHSFSFRVDSFLQVHHGQCEKLYELAKRLAKIEKHECVLDAYCGVGTIGLSIARESLLTGVERNAGAIACAKHNAKNTRARYFVGDATEYLEGCKESFDVVILDPPRAGTTKRFIHAVAKKQVKRVLYISCDPNTLVRDLAEFERCGYGYRDVYMVDMFPKTSHVECVVLMSKTE